MKKALLSLAIALAGLTGAAQTSASLLQSSFNEMKATAAKHSQSSNKIYKMIGGLPVTTILPDYGMSPKEYGMRYGRGNRNGKSNRLRYSHNAKMKRRG